MKNNIEELFVLQQKIKEMNATIPVLRRECLAAHQEVEDKVNEKLNKIKLYSILDKLNNDLQKGSNQIFDQYAEWQMDYNESWELNVFNPILEKKLEPIQTNIRSTIDAVQEHLNQIKTHIKTNYLGIIDAAEKSFKQGCKDMQELRNQQNAMQEKILIELRKDPIMCQVLDDIIAAYKEITGETIKDGFIIIEKTKHQYNIQIEYELEFVNNEIWSGDEDDEVDKIEIKKDAVWHVNDTLDDIDAMICAIDNDFTSWRHIDDVEIKYGSEGRYTKTTTYAPCEFTVCVPEKFITKILDKD